MAEVNYTALATNGAIVLPTDGVVLEAGDNPLKVANADRSLENRGGAVPEQTVLIVTATALTNLVIRQGEFPVSIARAYGDLTISLAIGTHVVGPFDSGQVMDNDGNIYLQGTGLEVVALLVPRH